MTVALTHREKQLLRLADSLLERTKSGNLEWQVDGTSKLEGLEFACAFECGSALVVSVEHDGHEPYELVVRNRAGDSPLNLS